MIQKPKFQINDIVNLPFDEIGIVIGYNEIPWGYPYQCRILKSTLSDPLSVGDFEEVQMSKVDFRSTDAKQLMCQAFKTIQFFDKQKQQFNHQNRLDPIEQMLYDNRNYLDIAYEVEKELQAMNIDDLTDDDRILHPMLIEKNQQQLLEFRQRIHKLLRLKHKNC